MELRAAMLVNIALTTLSAAFPLEDTNQFEEHVFYQKLDHFDPDDVEYFKQRYFKLDLFHRDGAPIFLEIEGETPTDGPTAFLTGIALKYQGVIMALEHRYYGKSIPLSPFYSEPRYLSSEQALEDIAYFIQAQKEQYPNSPWIVSGCSYAGNLATWMRQKYPHLVQGAIAGSAPLLLKADFYEYYEFVGEVLKKKAPLCHQKLVEASEEFTTLEKTPEGQRKLASMFGIARYYPHKGEHFHQKLAEKMSGVNGKNIQSLEYYLPYTSEVCNLITRNTHGKSTLEILINNYRLSGRTGALESVIRRAFDTDFLKWSREDYSMWTYQACNELGFFQTLSSKNQPFGAGPDLNDLYHNICDKWTVSLETLEDNIRKTNLRYGGKTPNVTNVVFMHGSNDPWLPLGVLRDLSSSARVFIFQGLSHCEFCNGRVYFQIAEDERIPEWMKMYDEIDSIIGSWF
ncbi:putative serine protease F56F10.1 [Anabrus simplex]|uniref:putative serine protease F56F10.1 n=1 Tax=Anabrus simplex TaxID=316456 RepID=UPI0035A362FD